MCRKTCSWLAFVSIEAVYCFISVVKAQDGKNSETHRPLPTPSTGVVVSVLTVIFCATILLLIYVKFCRSNPDAVNRLRRGQTLGGLVRSQSGLSGIDPTVIDSLPFFQFSSIRGSKQGLECAICITKFEEDETLRMLPKCKHAFHMKCVDQWLACHSSCPLCRYKVDEDDIKSFRHSFSSRVLGNIPSNLSDDHLNIDIFVQREQVNHHHHHHDQSSSRIRNMNQKHEPLHKFNHKIILSGVVSRSRWSDLNSSDLLSLKSEMLMDSSSKRFINGRNFHGGYEDEVNWRHLCETQDMDNEADSASVLNPAEKRSVSEIANVSRFAGTSMKSQSMNDVFTESNVREERLKRVWLPLARRTIQLFAGRQGRLQEQKWKRQGSQV